MNIQFAAAWLRAFSTSEDDVCAFYADAFDFADPPQERFIRADRQALAQAFRPLSNRDPKNGLGIHTLKVTEYLGDQNAGLVLWRWEVEHAETFFGMAAGGRAVHTTGMSYHVYQHGKILREVVYSDQIHVAKQLGFPVRFRHDAAKPTKTGDHQTDRGVRH